MLLSEGQTKPDEETKPDEGIAMADAQPAVAVAPKPKKNDGVATAAHALSLIHI